jgi:hypothetical protein
MARNRGGELELTEEMEVMKGGSDSCTRGGGQEVLEEGGRLPGVNDAKWRCDRDPCGGGDARSRGVGG